MHRYYKFLLVLVINLLIGNGQLFAGDGPQPIVNGKAITPEDCGGHFSEDIHLSLSNHVKGAYECDVTGTTGGGRGKKGTHVNFGVGHVMVATCHIAGSEKRTKMPCAVIAIGEIAHTPRKGQISLNKQVFFNGPLNSAGSESLCVELVQKNSGQKSTPTFDFVGRRSWMGSTSGGTVGAVPVENCTEDDLVDGIRDFNIF